VSADELTPTPGCECVKAVDKGVRGEFAVKAVDKGLSGATKTVRGSEFGETEEDKGVSRDGKYIMGYYTI
jgi:hypothetical protein